MTSDEKPSAYPPAVRVLVLVILLAGAVAGGWIFRDRIKEPVLAWRAGSLVSEAKALCAAGDWKTAERRALAAHQMAPMLFAPRQALFYATRETRSASLIPAAVSLANHPDSTDEDKLAALQTLLAAGEGSGFLYVHQQLDPALRARDDVVLLLVEFLVATQNTRQALTLVEERLRAGPDRRFLGEQARLLLLPGATEAEGVRGQGLLKELGAQRDGVFRRALNQLGETPLGRIRPDLLPVDAASWIEGLPDSSVAEKLLAVRLRIAAAAPDDREELVQRAIGDYRESSPETLAGWLLSLNRAEAVLGVIDEARGRESLALYRLRLRALESAQGPAAALAWLDKPHPDADEIDTLVGRAGYQLHLGQRAEALGSWEEAIRLAEVTSAPGTATKLYLNALHQEQMDVAVRVLLAACRRSTGDLPAAVALVPVMIYLEKNGRLEELRTVTEVLLRREEREGRNPVLQNNFAYLCFLLDRDKDVALKIAEGLVKQRPDSLPFRTTLALGLLTSGQPESALRALSPPGQALDWTAASPADLAIRAKVLERNGRGEEAAGIRKQFQATDLTPEERMLLGGN